MVHIVTNLNRGSFKRQIDQMHRDRKRLFVDRLKWDVSVVDGEFEVQKTQQFTEEVQAIGNAFDDRLNYTVGYYYYNYHGDEDGVAPDGGRASPLARQGTP